MSSKYTVYRNDIKYKSHKNIDPEKAIWNDDVKNDFHNKDTDSIDYRLEDCKKEKHSLIDLSHMNKNCFVNLVVNPTYLKLKPLLKQNLNHIFARECELTELPDLDCFDFLETLDISHNNLTVLPKLPRSLQELIVNNNKLIEIKEILPNLRRINANDNNIIRFDYPNSLERVHLKNNPISYIVKLDHVYFLDISHTKVKELHECPKLTYLDLTSTSITVLPTLNNLEHLTCNDSMLTDITNLKNLHSLVMINAKIDKVPFFKDLHNFIYKDNTKFMLAKQYSVKCIKKNKNDITEIIFNT